ncbi:MAG: 3-methyl-2-oxobutanoate hydroxymethyltransferase [Pseudomonadota bacterium]
MSTHVNSKKMTIPKITGMKGKGRIVSLTAYTTPMAKLMDAIVDIIIVGDSLGMVAYGMDSTMPVTLDMMIRHATAVVTGATQACVVVDLPFATYQESPEIAYRNAARVMAESGAQAVKIEVSEEMVETVAFLARRGIPVMPHIGLTPQYANTLGGFKVQGKSDEEASRLVALARSLERASAFALLVEGTHESAARRITEAVTIPVIGIGASPACDGQVLVTEDVLGLFSDYTPKFAKRYTNLAESVQAAFAEFASEVRLGSFPAAQHCFGVNAKERVETRLGTPNP